MQNPLTNSLSVNFHLLCQCNAHCNFCFFNFRNITKYLPDNFLPTMKDQLIIIEKLANAGFQKITFVGGEPLLCPWLNELARLAKSLGLTTMLCTNGFLLTDHIYNKGIDDYDWITLSIDSLNQETNRIIGRCINDRCWGLENYSSLVELIHSFSKRLKVNTVVSKYNLNENFVSFIKFAKPERWKLFQVLTIANQNNENALHFSITEDEFILFINDHKQLSEITNIVIERNADMTNSYIMVDPIGRLFQNSDREYHFSKISLLNADFVDVSRDVPFDFNRYIGRHGNYQW